MFKAFKYYLKGFGSDSAHFQLAEISRTRIRCECNDAVERPDQELVNYKKWITKKTIVAVMSQLIENML